MTETTETKPKTTRKPAASTVPAIYTSLQKVMEGVANIPKTGVMNFGKTNYTYLKADDVQERLNPLLRENNIIVRPDYTVENVTRGGDRQINYVYVALSMTYISTVDGSEHITGPFYGEAQASDDKSINKALTQALKNANRVIFQFASGEPEADDFPSGQQGQAAAPPKSTQPAALRNAAKQNAAKPTANSDNEALKARIRAAIESEKVTREAVNLAQEALKAEGKTGADINQGIIEALNIE